MELNFKELTIEEAQVILDALQKHRNKQPVSAKGGTPPQPGG